MINWLAVKKASAMPYMKVKGGTTNDLDPETIFADLGATPYFQEAIKRAVAKYWADSLARDYKKSTKKDLENPESAIDPKFGYIVDHAPNVNKDILNKLKSKLRNKYMGNWTSPNNITPILIDDAVKNYIRHNGVYKPIVPDRTGWLPDEVQGPYPDMVWEGKE